MSTGNEPPVSRLLSRSYHPAGYRAHPFHYVLILTDLLGRLPAWLMVPVGLGLALLGSWPWPGGLPLGVGSLTAACMLLDGLGLLLLPRVGRSYGPPLPPWLALALGHAVLALVFGWLWPTVWGLVACGLLHLTGTAIFFYATWIEPFRLEVTRATLCSARLNGGSPLRLLHISDLHVERRTRREEQLLRLVRELAPDLVVLTGDYLNLSYVRDPQAQSDARAVLAELCAAAGVPVFAVTGSPPVDLPDVVPALFSGLPIVWLHDRSELIERRGQRLQLFGLRCLRERALDVPRLERLLEKRPEDAFTLLLYHSPDLMPEAAALEVDLYLCGHTHGGQIRLPLLGALVTSSAFWKRYEMGRYRQGATTLYVSRGLGMEGLGTPRARLLCRPEMVLWTLRGSGDEAPTAGEGGHARIR